AAIAAHGGYPYKQIGDAFQVAFQTAPAALAAAVAAQRALAAEFEGSGPSAALRMTGDQGSALDIAEDPNSKLRTVRQGSAPGKLALRVRMALHTGSTEERGDDYVGPLLNR